MKCKECLFEFSKPAKSNVIGNEQWNICPHCRKPLPEKPEKQYVKRDYKRIGQI